MNNKQSGMDLLNCSVSGQNICGSVTTTGGSYATGGYGVSAGSYTVPAVAWTTNSDGSTLWGYWQNFYYPNVIRESYPVFIQDKAMDKGKHAFELVKALMDKKLLNVEKVKDFVEAMDTVLKAL